MSRWDNSDTKAMALPSNKCCITYSRFAYSGRCLSTDCQSTKPCSNPFPMAVAGRSILHSRALANQITVLSRRVYAVYHKDNVFKLRYGRSLVRESSYS